MATKRMTKIRLTTLRTMVVCWLFEEEGGGVLSEFGVTPGRGDKSPVMVELLFMVK